MKIGFEEGSRKISINSQEVLLPGPVWEIHVEQKKVIVVLNSSWGIRNVFCYDSEGKLLWIIEEPEYFKGLPGPGYQMVYRLGHNFELELVANMRHRPFLLNIETGKVTFIPGDFSR